MAGDDHRHLARQRVQPGLELADPGKVEMVGRFVEQQHVRIGDPDAGDQRQPLPAAAQRLHRPLAHRLRHVERIEHHVDAPHLAFGLLGRQGVGHHLMEAAAEKGGGNGLLDMADAQAARAGDVAGGRLHLAGQAFEQGRLAAAVGGNDAEPVAGADGEVEIGKERRTHGDAEGFEADQGHFDFSGLAGVTPVQCTLTVRVLAIRLGVAAPRRADQKIEAGKTRTVPGQPCKQARRAEIGPR